MWNMAKIIPIKENHLFSRVFSKGKSFAGKNAVVYVLKNYRTDQTKLGITVSKKLGGAVQRNRAKRMIREAFRLFLQGKSFDRAYLIVVVARGPLFQKKARMQDALADLERALPALCQLK